MSPKSKNPPNWYPCLFFPGIRLRKPIEADPLALVAHDDTRLEELRSRSSNLDKFLNSFTDPFGVRVRPSVLLVNSHADRRYFDIARLASFRNAISVAVTGYGQSLELAIPQGHRVLYGDSFQIYPWVLAKDDQYVVCNTPATNGLHLVTKFRGQPSASIPCLDLNEHGIDEPLSESLLMRWQIAHTGDDHEWADTALFRSLNMAYHASLIPAGRDYTLYDIGRTVALWVSAFEILIHPGPGEKAGRDRVIELLERAPWKRDGCSQPTHTVKFRDGKKKRKLASWLYDRLNRCRNDFLHGNPVSTSTLELPAEGRYVHQYAAPLYRMALTSFLDLDFRDPEPRAGDTVAEKAYAKRSVSFNFTQHYVESALLSALTRRPKDDQD